MGILVSSLIAEPAAGDVSAGPEQQVVVRTAGHNRYISAAQANGLLDMDVSMSVIRELDVLSRMVFPNPDVPAEAIVSLAFANQLRDQIDRIHDIVLGLSHEQDQTMVICEICGNGDFKVF